MAADNKALLVLEDGTVHRGVEFGAVGQTLGEAVFCTAMTGYQETLTDPSYARQIVVATAPQIGNTGWNREDGESRAAAGSGASGPNQDSGTIWVAGYAVRNPTRRVSNWRASGSLDAELVDQVVGIAGIDTRALVRRLRDHGSMRAGVFSGDALAPDAELLDRVREQPSMKGQNLIGEVSTTASYTIEPEGEARFTVVAVDLGIKTNTPRMFAERGMRVHVVPSTITLDEVRSFNPDGFFLSNGPGDPATAAHEVELTRGVLDAGLPLFGICLGNQLLGRAFGLDTYKMKFGHRGINIPVVEDSTGRISITAQNHGFALEGERGQEFGTDFGRARVSHVCANDGTVEGVELLSGRAFSVQYHPEAAAGPHDAAYLFDKFASIMSTTGEK
ncbi:glutamine-hydrolyzing carbamoyl-phosphate synthase small subunit [Tsukamurella sp. PLM1]|uniref:glutamine-hydrolyzing carbamoyl-phosphate synthase small subunit n=1 Tax=Tsukamurella sp. PLM1 TaxID=2929795 RepID=UPI00206F6955|nr:glutamine-hydrolyzing carbamoyl-phosphate synthase small subunit [Tsukamurella sp. PLM1]BDH57996.1 carbamoyl-phosphate synthase small chain [Tsukamurella sp. PLM1]